MWLRLAGLRQIEIDVFADPNGTLFSTAAGQKLAGGNGTLASSEYAQSGFKVLQPRSIAGCEICIALHVLMQAPKHAVQVVFPLPCLLICLLICQTVPADFLRR